VVPEDGEAGDEAKETSQPPNGEAEETVKEVTEGNKQEDVVAAATEIPQSSEHEEGALVEESKAEEITASQIGEGNPTQDVSTLSEPNDATKSPSSSSPPLEEYWATANCDGRCGFDWTYASEMYCCRDCIGFQFEAGCYAKIQAGTLRRKVCDKSHEFFFVPKWDHERMDAVPKGSVPVGAEVLTLEEWKGRIRKRYVEFDEEKVVEVTGEDQE
jgi:hypothetical protein